MEIINIVRGAADQKILWSFLPGLLLGTVLSLFILFPGDAYSDQATVSWVAPTTNVEGAPLTGLSGYKIYYGTASHKYTQAIDAGNVTTSTVPNLNGGSTYYFAVTAYDKAGLESAYSNEVSKTTALRASVQQYTLSVSKGGAGSGTVTSSPGGINCGTVCSSSYSPGSVTTLTAAPASGATFTGWSGGGCTGTGTCSLSMNANMAVTASFATAAVNRYTITASAARGGKISPSGSVAVSGGTSQTFTITPSSGYSVSNVRVDGASVGAVTTYTFGNVTANHRIAASFIRNYGVRIPQSQSGRRY